MYIYRKDLKIVINKIIIIIMTILRSFIYNIHISLYGQKIFMAFSLLSTYFIYIYTFIYIFYVKAFSLFLVG